MINRRLIGAFSLGILTGTAITGATILLASPAKADPAQEVYTLVCSSLDAQPTVPNVVAILNDLVTLGATPYQAGQIVATSVTEYCARNIPVVQAFLHEYAPEQATAKTKIGGKIS